MNALLARLGISPEIQAFFGVKADLSFNFGDQQERFGEGFHIVPSTPNLWVGGSQNATNVIISYSVMEAMAFITLKRHRYPRLDGLAFVAIGNRYAPEQALWIKENFPERKFTLVFGNDLVGRITDVKLTAGIKALDIRIFHSGDQIFIYRGSLLYIFDQDALSLHGFQEALAIRPRFRTGKPVQSSTFLNQLIYDAER